MMNIVRLLILLLLPASAFAQGTIVPFIPQYFTDAAGHPLSGGKLCTYAAGTTTPQATYSDVTLATTNSNPVILSSNGRPTSGAIYLSPTAYKFVLLTAGTDATCSTGTTLWTLDNVSAVPTSSGNIDVTGTAGEALAMGDVVYLSDGSGGTNSGRWYKADADNQYSSTRAGMVGIATAVITSGTSGTIRLSGKATGLAGLTSGSSYYVSATAGGLTATAPANARIVGEADSTTTLVFTSNPRPIVTQPLKLAEGRLTATSGMCVTTGDVSATATIYYTPCGGNRIALYDGTAWTVRTFSEITISVSSCTASKPYDVFLYDNAGTVTAEQLVWTDATTRATALTTQDGVYVKTGALTRRYIGTYYCNATGGKTDDSAAKRNIWNYYNRVARKLSVIESTGSWTYTTATWRQARATATNQLEFVVGVSEDMVTATVIANWQNDTAGAQVGTAIGLDSTTTPSSDAFRETTASDGGTSYQRVSRSEYRGFPGVGRHVLVWLEISQASGTTQWNSANGSGTAGAVSGITGMTFQ